MEITVDVEILRAAEGAVLRMTGCWLEGEYGEGVVVVRRFLRG